MLNGFEDYTEVPPVDEDSTVADAARELLLVLGRHCGPAAVERLDPLGLSVHMLDVTTAVMDLRP